MAANPYLAYAGPKSAPLETLKSVVDAIGTQGASNVTYTMKGAGGSVQKFTITPAVPVAPLTPSKVESLINPPPAAPAPGFFQAVRSDGTVGPNWLRIGAVAAAGVAVLGAVVSFSRRRR